jgi:hypothetical protein
VLKINANPVTVRDKLNEIVAETIQIDFGESVTAPCSPGKPSEPDSCLDQPPCFKLKANQLLKLVPGKGWAKVAGISLFMCKVV